MLGLNPDKSTRDRKCLSVLPWIACTVLLYFLPCAKVPAVPLHPGICRGPPKPKTSPPTLFRRWCCTRLFLLAALLHRHRQRRPFAFPAAQQQPPPSPCVVLGAARSHLARRQRLVMCPSLAARKHDGSRRSLTGSRHGALLCGGWWHGPLRADASNLSQDRGAYVKAEWHPPRCLACRLSLNSSGLDLMFLDTISTNPRLVLFYVKHGCPAHSQRCRATPPPASHTGHGPPPPLPARPALHPLHPAPTTILVTSQLVSTMPPGPGLPGSVLMIFVSRHRNAALPTRRHAVIPHTLHIPHTPYTPHTPAHTHTPTRHSLPARHHPSPVPHTLAYLHTSVRSPESMQE